MTFLQMMAAALLHGLFEAVPVGTGAADALLIPLTRSPEGWAALMVAVWFGLGLAIMLVLWRDMVSMSWGVIRLFKGRIEPGARLLARTLTTAIPTMIASWAVLGMTGSLLSPILICSLYLIFALILAVADQLGVTVRRLEHLGWGETMIFALLACISLLPGISRSGLMVTGARLLGFERHDAMRFALLSLWPVLIAQAVMMTVIISHRAELIFSPDLLLALATACLSGVIGLMITLSWLNRHSFAPLVVLRLVFGAACLGALVFLPV